MLRRLAKIPHPYISRVSNAAIRRRCNATRFSIQILRSQLRWLGHILRREPTDPLRLVIFEPGTLLLPRLTGTGRKRVVGRPRIDWAQTFIDFFVFGVPEIITIFYGFNFISGFCFYDPGYILINSGNPIFLVLN